MKTAVLIFPASNCDRDMLVALSRFAGKEALRIWHQDTHIPDDVDVIAIPGGFSYGDYLRCGAMAAHSAIMPEVKRHAERGTKILGVCNGFQILTESGLLAGALLRNQRLKFICRSVYIRPEQTNNSFLREYQQNLPVSIPIAHHDGNYFADAATLDALEQNQQVAFRYCDAAGAVTAAANPNGSVHNIAGIFNKKKNILGMMPHPERAIDPALPSGIDGANLFSALMAA